MSGKQLPTRKLDWRRGLKRIAIVYLVIWAIVALVGWYLYSTGQDGVAQSLRNSDWTTSKMYAERSTMGMGLLANSALWGVALPILGTIVVAIGFWIARGFRSEAGAAE